MLMEKVSHGRIVSGASTLTMQLARLMEPSPRTLGAKLAENKRLENEYSAAKMAYDRMFERVQEFQQPAVSGQMGKLEEDAGAAGADLERESGDPACHGAIVGPRPNPVNLYGAAFACARRAVAELWPAALASLLCFGLNAGLLHYLNRIDR